MGMSEWAAIAWSPESCSQALGQAGEKSFPAQLSWGLEGLQTEPQASPKPQE